MAQEERRAVKNTLSERGNKYGLYEDNAQMSQWLKEVAKKGRNYGQLSDVQRESLDLIFTKISRILGGNPNYIDNWHDIAGYATLVEDDLKKLDEYLNTVKVKSDENS